jgi:hypothetical protein
MITGLGRHRLASDLRHLPPIPTLAKRIPCGDASDIVAGHAGGYLHNVLHAAGWTH